MIRFLAFFLGLTAAIYAAPVELGTVEWTRDYDKAVTESKRSGKPLFLLFQEVPGWQGCRNFGSEVLSNTSLVKLIEEHFVPLAIHNNSKGGKDAEILKRFKEPAWNYQVIRFVDAHGKDLIPRKDRVWTLKPLAERMIKSLEKAKRPVPESLRTLAK